MKLELLLYLMYRMAKNKVLIVGMNPSNTLEKVKVRKNSTFDRLNKWMDRLGVCHYSFINVINDRNIKLNHKNVDDKFLLSATKDYNHIIALGGFASDSLVRAKINHFRLPHPSPLNRLLNDKHFEKAILNQCSKYLKG